jgi:hypothetical protein
MRNGLNLGSRQQRTLYVISGLTITSLRAKRIHLRQWYVDLIYTVNIILIFNKSKDGDEFFAAIDNFGKSVVGDPLEDYLNSPPISSVTDPIMWWSGLSNNGNDPLARMAIDVLSCAGKILLYNCEELTTYHCGSIIDRH